MSNRERDGGGEGAGSGADLEHVAWAPVARRKPGRKPPPPGETRREAFVRLANARVQEAIDRITLIGNLANTKNYTRTAEDVNQIEAALLEAVRLTIAAFRSPKAVVPGFRLTSADKDSNDRDE
ncbi:MAG TPA: hypothetical protein VJ770_28790 [Stellaceae bacterium]|nr:hypothetical protein [Stellaceae bacterium]